MKIAIVGAQCTGKTTLLNALQEIPEFKDYVYVKEIVRSLNRERSIKINKDADFDSQISIFKKHEEILEFPNFITDRSSIDAMVYSYRNFKHGLFEESEFLEFEKLFLDTAYRYDKVFFIPVEFELEEDGFRSADRKFQQEINSLFFEIFRSYELDFISLTGSLQSRLNTFKFHTIEKN